MNRRIKLGIVGVGRALFVAEVNHASLNAFDVTAVCDPNDERLQNALRNPQLGLTQARAFSTFEDLLAHGDIEAVVIGSPMPLHATQAMAALRRGIHVLSEVTAGVSLDECRALVETCRTSRAIYFFAENMNYFRHVALVTELVRRGLFGETYYAEAEYIHELKAMQLETPWRRHWHTGINGITYGTHSLGPVLQWMPGDRVVSISCVGSGHHQVDALNAPFEMEDTCVMLGKTARGGLIKIRLDFLTDRPGGHFFTLQGKDGTYESSRGPDEKHKIWLRSRAGNSGRQWSDLNDLADEFLPEFWKRNEAAAVAASHGGSDYFVARDFALTVLGQIPCPIGIHEAMDMTLPGLISQASIQQQGAWLPVPDSRTW